MELRSILVSFDYSNSNLATKRSDNPAPQLKSLANPRDKELREIPKEIRNMGKTCT